MKFFSVVVLLLLLTSCGSEATLEPPETYFVCPPEELIEVSGTNRDLSPVICFCSCEREQAQETLGEDFPEGWPKGKCAWVMKGSYGPCYPTAPELTLPAPPMPTSTPQLHAPLLKQGGSISINLTEIPKTANIKLSPFARVVPMATRPAVGRPFTCSLSAIRRFFVCQNVYLKQIKSVLYILY